MTDSTKSINISKNTAKSQAQALAGLERIDLLLVRGTSFGLWFMECSQGIFKGLRGAIFI
jgi:hypothetical protein